jgi:hypothetical protein
MRRARVTAIVLVAASLAVSALQVTTLGRQLPDAETYFAQATITSNKSFDAYAPMSVTIERFASDADRDNLRESLKDGGTSAARKLLSRASDLGTVQVGSKRSTIKYAYARVTTTGRVITVLTTEPIRFVGDRFSAMDAEPGLGLVILITSPSGQGYGQLIPTAKIRMDDRGTIVTDGYSGRMVPLSQVTAR